MSSPLNNFRKVVNKKKINEQTIEDLNGKPAYEVIDLIKPERMKGSVKEDITETEMKLGDETVTDFKTVNFDSLIPMLTKAVQELKAENDDMRARLDALES